jgi:hypothetical protein
MSMTAQPSAIRSGDNRTVFVRLSGPELYSECIDCGHEFHVDSSPEFDVCWQCSERRAEETD